MYNLSNNVRNKLKLDNSTSFCWVRKWDEVPHKKFERVLYNLQENDNEGVVLTDLLKLCLPGSLVLVCDVPEVNKRLSNGVLKYNKDVLSSVLMENGVERFWFFESGKEDSFELLLEVK